MTEEELKQILQSAQNMEIDEERKERDIRFVVEAARDIRGIPKLTYGERIWSMTGYLSPWIWFLQAVILMGGGYFTCAIAWEDSQIFFSMAAPLIGCIGCTEIYRGYTCGMWEMEKACRYDLRQVVLLKMQITGSADLALILCMMCFGKETGMTLSQAILGVLVPYLLAAFVYFMLLCRMDRNVSNYLLAAVGIFMSLGSAIIMNCIDDVTWERISEHGEWTALLVIVAADMMLAAMRRFLRYCDREDDRRWNFD